MTTIYLDESGDLGFKLNNSSKGSSNYFVISLYETNLEEKQLKKFIKISKQRTIKKKTKKSAEIKGFSTNIKTKDFLLNHLIKNDINCKLFSIVVNKNNIPVSKKYDLRIFYHHICKEILSEITSNNLNLILDKKDVKEEFTRDLIDYLETCFIESNFKVSCDFSHNHSGLQIVDLIANSTFRRFEREETVLFSIFENKLILKKYYFI
jgi:hypothetical protein